MEEGGATQRRWEEETFAVLTFPKLFSGLAIQVPFLYLYLSLLADPEERLFLFT